MDRDVAPAWIVANFTTMAVAGVLMVAAFVLRGALEVTAPAASSIVKTGFVVFEIAIAVIYMALYARMTGAVLRRIIPALPRRGWLGVHLAFGVIVGTGLGLMMLEPDSDEAIDWANEEFLIIAFILALGGMLLGAVFGGLQAAVLRRAARGLWAWIGMSALAMGVVTLAAIAILVFEPAPRTLAFEVVEAVLFTVVGTVAAVMMLPALRRLRPRVVTP